MRGPLVLSVVVVVTSQPSHLPVRPKACRALLQVERQKSFASAQQELQSLTARYRGPLLEACVDLENRLWHLANATSEWKNAEGECLIVA